MPIEGGANEQNGRSCKTDRCSGIFSSLWLDRRHDDLLGDLAETVLPYPVPCLSDLLCLVVCGIQVQMAAYLLLISGRISSEHDTSQCPLAPDQGHRCIWRALDFSDFGIGFAGCNTALIKKKDRHLAVFLLITATFRPSQAP